MSLDINWSLLSQPDESTAEHLSDSLINLLNTQLAEAHRPSFIGPITVTSFDFGKAGPELEIKDIRDVWRVFDQGDDEGDFAEEEKKREKEREERDRLANEALKSSLDGEKYELVDQYSHTEGTSSFEYQPEYDMQEQHNDDYRIRGRRPLSYTFGYPHDQLAVHRSSSSRSFIRFPFDQPPLALHIPPTPGLNPSLVSHPVSARFSRRPMSIAASPAPHPAPRHRPIDACSTSPSPPAHPAGLPPKASSSSVPSLQLHLRLSHASDLHLTLLTSLQVNYPSALFMALPLKLSITGFQLDADIVIAYSGEKNRVHFTIVDDESNPAHKDDKQIPLGQRLLSNLQIESEIGHADAHVLRNVGKVERFIVDVVRKTLVDELVFPNFHTVAL
ncbi:mitochondrial distribution and morphology protein 12 [Cryptococcus deuterogattii MMRL2647]|nr:mitochondrial distribution and morphology protein 12 [Cryptococcus deuterogattii MMRL2647]